jgi:uncharacterized membrane protein (DUF373 family)
MPDVTDSAAGPPPAGSPAGSPTGPSTARRWSSFSGVRGSIWLLEHATDIVTAVIGAILIVLAAVLLVAAIIDFFATSQPVAVAASSLLDSILLVLILVEIVHTVVLSLQAHRLVAQPFIVVGLVAVIRRILFVLSHSGPDGQIEVSTAQLAVLIGMVVVFVAALIAVSRYEKHEE